MGGTPSGPSKKMIQNDIVLNHLSYVLNSGKYEKSNINLQVFALLVLSKFPVIHSLVIYGKKIISKILVNR